MSKIFLGSSLVFLLFNFVYISFFWSQPINLDYGQYYKFTAKVVERDKKIKGWNLVVEPMNLVRYERKIIVYVGLYPEYSLDDRLEINCRLDQPTAIIDDSGKQFAYDKFLAKDDIFAQCRWPQIRIIGSSDSNILHKVKNYFWRNLNSNLTEPASSIAKAMFLAERREISDNIRDSFAKVGLSHIIAISGLHIAIIVFLLQSVLIQLGLSRQQIPFIVIAVLVAYLSILNWPSSATRATAMVAVLLINPYLGRNTNSIYSLLLVADIFVFINPLVLVYDIGFQLSFLAVLGILFYGKWLTRNLSWLPNRFKIREIIAVTLSAQIFSWPIIVYNFGITSLISPLANLLVLPLLPLVLVLIMLLAVVGSWSAGASVIAWPLTIILRLIVEATIWLSQLPGAYWLIDDFGAAYLLLSLLFMFGLTYIIKPQNNV